VSALVAHLARIGGNHVKVVLSPEEVPSNTTKPFEITIAGKLVYSMLTPVAGETGPILFETNQWWGEPVPEHLERVTTAVQAALPAN
jgi:hypothetical protein